MTIKILLVDPDSRSRSIIARAIENEFGYFVKFFGNLDAARKAFPGGGFDAVILCGTVQSGDDGWVWGIKLHGWGVKVFVISSSRPEKVPAGLDSIDIGAGLSKVTQAIGRFLRGI